MKKIVLFAMLGLFLASCKDDCREKYELNFVVRNDTDREITASTNSYYDDLYGTETQAVTIAPGESEIVVYQMNYGDCNNKTLLKDIFLLDDALIPYGDDPDEFAGHGYMFVITADEEELSDEIWQNQYWEFAPGYYDLTYTLIITEELIDEFIVHEAE